MAKYSVVRLDINGKDNEYNYYPFFCAIYNNNIEMVKLLMDYANNNNLVLELNDKNKKY